MNENINPIMIKTSFQVKALSALDKSKTACLIVVISVDNSSTSFSSEISSTTCIETFENSSEESLDIEVLSSLQWKVI